LLALLIIHIEGIATFIFTGNHYKDEQPDGQGDGSPSGRPDDAGDPNNRPRIIGIKIKAKIARHQLAANQSRITPSRRAA